MSQVASYKIDFETPTHFGSAEVEVAYKYETNPFGADEAYYRGEDDSNVPCGTFQFFEIVITDKKTGVSEDCDEMPDDLINIAKETAADSFEV